MISVGELAPAGCWDTNMLDLLFQNQLYPTGLEFRKVLGYPNTDGCILVVPGRYWFEHVDQINEAIRRYEWLLFIRTSDEEDQFDISRIEHPNARFWVQTPKMGVDYQAARLFGVGFPPHLNDLGSKAPDKAMDVFLSAQRTHQRRQLAFDALGDAQPNRCVEATEGFTQGLPPQQYADRMVNTKVAPAPSGAVSPDSFRLYEALEAHCVPIADDVSPVYDSRGYWRSLFPDAPFPIIENYTDLPGYIEDALRDWPCNANRIAAWWMRYKREMTSWLRDDLKQLGAL